jgi:hypothetical protein
VYVSDIRGRNQNNLWKVLLHCVPLLLSQQNWTNETLLHFPPWLTTDGAQIATRDPVQKTLCTRRLSIEADRTTDRLRGAAALLSTKEWIEIMQWRMKFLTNSGNFWHFPNFVTLFLKISRHFVPDHCCEIPAKFHKIFAEKTQNSSNNADEIKFH